MNLIKILYNKVDELCKIYIIRLLKYYNQIKNKNIFLKIYFY